MKIAEDGTEPARSAHADIAWPFKLIGFMFPLIFLFFAFVQVQSQWQLGLFVWIVLTLVFAIKPATKTARRSNAVPWYDWILIAASAVVCLNYILNYTYYIQNIGGYTQVDNLLMSLAVALSIEAARRSIGIVVPTLTVAFISYAVWIGFPPSILLTRIYVGESGMFGTITDVFARYVLLFFIFGAVMERAGAAEFLQRYMNAIAGKVTAGSAKGCIFGSGFLGMLIGTSAGNISVSGPLTIPLMKREGYSAGRASGIEVASSIGGEMSPPVMGSAAFLIVANTGIPYKELMLISVLPAILYYWTIFIMVHFEGRRDVDKIDQRILSDERPGRLVLEYIHLLLAPVVLVVIIAMGYSPTYAAAGGTIAAILLSQVSKSKRISFRDLGGSLISGSFNFVSLGAMVPILGIILVSVLLVGLPTHMSSWALTLAAGQLYLVLIGTFLLALVLGMGMPIVAAYMILATVAGPALGQFAVPAIAIHLFLLWCAQTSAITPPVALASYIASIIAGCTMWRTSIEAMRYGIGMLVMPALIIYSNIVADGWGDRLVTFGFAFLGFTLWAAFVVGYAATALSAARRLLVAVTIVCLCIPNLWVNVAAGLMGLTFFAIDWQRGRHPVTT